MRWYVVQTHPKSEDRAVLHLRRQGFHVYVPKCPKEWRHARRVEIRAVPLFPRYIFVAMDPAVARWRSILSTVGVSRLISHGNSPVPVPQGVVEDLQHRENEKGLIPIAVAAAFKKGDHVEVASGPLGSAVGLFEGLSDDERVIVLMEIMGRKIQVKVPLETVAPAA